MNRITMKDIAYSDNAGKWLECITKNIFISAMLHVHVSGPRHSLVELHNKQAALTDDPLIRGERDHGRFSYSWVRG